MKQATNNNRTRIYIIRANEIENIQSFVDYLQSTNQVQVELAQSNSIPDNLPEYHLLIHSDPGALPPEDQKRIQEYILHGGSCIALIGSTAHALPDFYGVQPGQPGPTTELRLTLVDPDCSAFQRLPGEFLIYDRFIPIEITAGNVQHVLDVGWQYQKLPVAVEIRHGNGRIFCTTLQSVDQLILQQFLYRAIRRMTGFTKPNPLSVAILGYSPAVGYLHGKAAQETPGLTMSAVSDLSPARLEQAQLDFPGIKVYDRIEQLGDDPNVEIVIIATPPNSHATLAIQLLEAGKHVVVEKPMCITTREADEMMEKASIHARLLSVYHNRRWDLDFLAIRQAVVDGLIGEPFYLETFIGDYAHPCEYWHSHVPISGGALYDWGAHYIDWILNLFPGPTSSVTGSLHKRIWHDVTNADQVRTQIRFQDGREAEFLQSDLAALRKPKWYMLGTQGAIIGDWNKISIRNADPLDFLHEQEIPVTETVPRLTLRRRHQNGSFFEQTLPLPQRQSFPYHTNLADHLLTGEPLAVTPQSAARVIAVMEASTRSALNGGTTEKLVV